MKHSLERCDRGVRCIVCGATWKEPPTSECPGISLYHPATTPSHLKTRAELQAMGLTAGANPPAACIQLSGYQRWLYDQTQATPRAPFDLYASPSDLAGKINLEKPPEIPPERGQLYRQSAVAWARSLVTAPLEWVIVSIQTTGLRRASELIEIAIITPEEAVLLDTLVRPAHCIPIYATRINGITDRMVYDAPPFSQIARQVSELLFGKLIVAYAVNYTRAMINRSLAAARQPALTRVDWQAAITWYARYCGDGSMRFGEANWRPLPGNVNRALDDSFAILRLVQGMAAETAPVGQRSSSREYLNQAIPPHQEQHS